jgi:hypothetical protein
MVDHFKFIQGNTKEGIQFTVKDRNTDTAVDISGSSITFRVFNQDLTTLRFSQACDITNGPAGICEYVPTVSDTDFDNTGKYSGELEITFSDGRIGKIQNIAITISPKAPTS